ncbi:MAG: hypothetical protein H6568_10040 [Lewinellaceae bacterium]|nr:hypothetical protein [Lewinellaceae bacterium]
MKKYLFSGVFLLFSMIILLGQQVPQSFKYQGVARVDQDVVVGQIGLRLSVHQGTINGNIVYREAHQTTTNEVGVFSVEAGNGSVISGTFSSIDWGDGPYFLEVELDPAGGSAYVVLGATQIMSVPYALYASKAGSVDGDTDQDPQNEIQTVSKSGSVVTLSKGGGSFSVDDNDASVTNEIQLLSKSGTNLTLSKGGGTVSIDDADSNPTNEIQSLSLNGSNLSISSSNSVNLSSVINSIWKLNGSTAYYDAGNVSAGLNMSVGSNLFVDEDIYVEDDIFGNSFILGTGTSGFLSTFDGSTLIALLSRGSQGGGYFETNGPNGLLNSRFTYNTANPNHGYMAVYDELETIQAGMYVDAFGNGYIFADGASGGIKSFRMPHPTIPESKIWYACIEGPEVAAYDRGTGTLINGEVFIDYSELTGIVINPETVTVTLTPHSTNTYGLAVVEKSDRGFKVKELMNGHGNFSFDWHLTGVRRGHEGFRTIRDATEEMPAGPAPRQQH